MMPRKSKTTRPTKTLELESRYSPTVIRVARPIRFWTLCLARRLVLNCFC